MNLNALSKFLSNDGFHNWKDEIEDSVRDSNLSHYVLDSSDSDSDTDSNDACDVKEVVYMRPDVLKACLTESNENSSSASDSDLAETDSSISIGDKSTHNDEILGDDSLQDEPR